MQKQVEVDVGIGSIRDGRESALKTPLIMSFNVLFLRRNANTH